MSVGDSVVVEATVDTLEQIRKVKSLGKVRQLKVEQIPQARKASGEPVHPASGVVPILKEEIKGKELSVIGTGFFISRYGLFVTAAHVIRDLIDDQGLGVGFIIHVPENFEGNLYLRRIKRVTYFDEVDLAIGQADNYVSKHPQNPLVNLRCMLSSKAPSAGSPIHTYAYPENRKLEFGDNETPPTIHGDRFDGNLLEIVPKALHVPYVNYQTSIRIRAGASGGPVFDENGKVFGVNCRGWDFDGGEHEGDELSTIIPIQYLLEMNIELLQLPDTSWEYNQLPDPKQETYSVRELAEFGHLVFET